MGTHKRGSILLWIKGKLYRFQAERLILLHSDGDVCTLHIHVPDRTQKVETITSGHAASHFSEDLIEAGFYDVRQGWYLNLDFYLSMTSDRDIDLTVDLPIRITVARDRKEALLARLKQG